MRIGRPIVGDDGKLWPVEEAMYKSEFVSHWRDSFYRKVFKGWKTVGMFKSKTRAEKFMKENR